MTTFDPYYQWLGIPPKQQPPNHYRLLGIELLEDDPTVIENAADRQMAFLRNCQTGSHSKESQRLLNEVAMAKNCLLNPAAKAAYDARLVENVSAASVLNPESTQAVPLVPDLDTAQAVRGSPDAGHVATEGLLESQEVEEGNHGDLRSSLSAGSEDPRRALGDPRRVGNARQVGDAGKARDAGQASAGEFTFGDYQVTGQLDRSKTGGIFKAKRRDTGRTVALKIISFQDDQLNTLELLERFRRKVKILKRLDHPNLVRVLDAGQHDKVYYLAMPWIDGQSLEQFMKRLGKLPIPHAVNYTMQAATGLACAHALGVFHRNVCPANLLVHIRTGVLKVVGLGEARISQDLSGTSVFDQLTSPGSPLGTVDYVAPEQSTDASTVDHRADIYSLGCTLYHMLTGAPPYPVKSPLRKIIAHQNDPIPPLGASRPDMPMQLDMIYQRMVAKRPEDRWQSMDELLEVLAKVA